MTDDPNLAARARRRWGAAVAFLIAAAPCSAAHLAVVVDPSRPRDRMVVSALERDLGTENVLHIHDIRSVDLGNPIARGRLLARLAAADVVVPVGTSASELVANELDESRVFFIAAGILSGKYLSKRNVAGVLSFSPEEMLKTAKKLLPRTHSLAVIYTPGYEPMLEGLRAAAAGLGIDVSAQPVTSRADIGNAVRGISSEADLLWLAPDPMLVHDVIFSYLLNESLQVKRPVVAPVSAYVKKGALFCVIPDPGALADAASSSLSLWLAADPKEFKSGWVRGSPPGGTVLINHNLAERWGIVVPPSLRRQVEGSR